MKPPSLTPPDFGRLCYREPGEPRDERPALRVRPFWDSPEEAEAYLSAARSHPREVDPQADTIESAAAYIARLAGIVAKGPLAKAAKRFPSRPWLNRDYTGPRPEVKQDGLTFEDRLDEIYTREPGEEG